MAGLLTGPASTDYQSLFVPAVCLLIMFLGYSSQWLFNVAENLEPGPMTKRETAILNILLACLWLTYYKACTVPRGRYDFLPKAPPTSKKSDDPSPTSKDGETPLSDKPADTPTTSHPDPEPKTAATTTPTTRWCKKCDAPKPLRAHHCRLCKTCIPKMDHHCPWTNNCVSLQTFPYFLRFLVYTNLALGYLLWWLLYPRLRLIFWDNSALPSYLGPSVPVLVHLVLLAITGCLVSFALVILLVTTVRGWVLNITMIEGWEQERHEAVLLRARRAGWWTGSGAGAGDGGNGGGGSKVKIERVEFPYDIGFFANMAQAMGTKNILTWLDPLIGGGPKVSREVGRGTGWEWEENGFNDREGMWPPTDPEKLRRAAAGAKGWPGSEAARQHEAALVDKRWASPLEEMAAFRARQEMDLRRRRGTSGVIAELGEGEGIEDLEEYDYVDQDSGGSGGYYDEDEDEDDDEDELEKGASSDKAVPVIPGQGYYERGFDGEPGWTNSEGDRLRDFGVDEDVEDDDEDVPLGELLRRRKAYGKDR
ncbi:DHHC zinc finger domain-containing protein [Diaporthe helianthi]|uniref:Palmitoyltransferase PFA4 n=1 Tax=Diaporthe helianthi TaxID=158607 RepID=A0A2P5I5G7_DIAHE|nr:DHHC zinc finger domain-containing protein [Diaporthe helianthi]